MKRCNISEGLHFEVPEGGECFYLNYLPDNAAIPILADEIDRMIKALQQVKANYEMKVLEEIDKDKLKRWIGENE